MINIESQLRDLLAQGRDRIPHGLLLVGPRGIGKATLAEGLIRHMLCEARETDAPCGDCPSCLLLAADSHPDIRRVGAGDEEGEDEGKADRERKPKNKQIRIDQVRALEDFVFVGSHRQGRRLILIDDAEAMNPAAANALLKLLEEPPPSVYFILISSNERALLPTIRSRCRIFRVPKPAPSTVTASSGLGADAGRWLALSSGAPLRVRRWQEDGLIDPLRQLIDSLGRPGTDPLALASRWDSVIRSAPNFTIDELIEEILRWVHDLTRQAVSQPPRFHPDMPGTLQASGRPSLADLSDTWQELMQFRRVSRHPLNQMLFLETIASRYLRAFRSARS